MTSQPSPSLATLVATRQALHGVAELVMAGPQHRRSGTIRLRITPGGFATVTAPELRVDGDELVAGSGRVRLTGRTYGDLAAAVGVDVGAPDGLYAEGSGWASGDRIEVDTAAAEHLADCLERGERALRTLAPDQTPVLWPEHFDLGISVGEVNYGISLGDEAIGEPYAYVGPWKQRSGEFWNHPFGAARVLQELPDVDTLVMFLGEGQKRAGVDPVAT